METINLEQDRIKGPFWIEANWSNFLMDKDLLRQAYSQMVENQIYNIEWKIKYFFTRNINPILSHNIVTYLKQFGLDDKTATEVYIKHYIKLAKFLQVYPQFQAQFLPEQEERRREHLFETFEVE